MISRGENVKNFKRFRFSGRTGSRGIVRALARRRTWPSTALTLLASCRRGAGKRRRWPDATSSVSPPAAGPPPSWPPGSTDWTPLVHLGRRSPEQAMTVSQGRCADPRHAGCWLRSRPRPAVLPIMFTPTLAKKIESWPFWRVVFSEGRCQHGLSMVALKSEKFTFCLGKSSLR